jgi:o-succinylbenzoate---CoA ligase
VGELVALALPGGPAYVDALRRVWDGGDAVLPLDPRAPAAHTGQVLAALRPGAVVEADGERRSLDGGLPVETDDAVVIATSGTTGTPKGAVHTHRGIEDAAFMTATALGIGPDVRWLACLPLSHVGGFSVLTRALLTEAGLEVHDTADPDAIGRAARAGATHVSLVPTLLRRIDPTPWRVILLGGSAIPADRPANTVATYGMTETFGGVVYDGLALNGVAVRIAGDAAGPGATESGGDGAGPIEISSPSLLRCYRDGTDPTVRGWFRTGDLGSIDPSTGRLAVHGRADDLIITGGEKVWPEPVEDVLRTDPAVADAAVVGLADPEWGHRVVALVVPADPSRPPTLESLRRLVKEHLPVAAAPKAVELVDSLPRTAIGKLARRRILRHHDGVGAGPGDGGGGTSDG